MNNSKDLLKFTSLIPDKVVDKNGEQVENLYTFNVKSVDGIESDSSQIHTEQSHIFSLKPKKNRIKTPKDK